MIAATTLIALSTFVPQQPDTREAASELRVYDLSALRMERYEPQSFGASLLPYIELYGEMPDSTSETEERSGAEVLVDLVTSLLADEFEYEGREIHLREGSRMVVRGPRALQQRIEVLLSFLEERLNAQATLAVDVVRHAPGDLALTDGALLPVAVVEDWLEGLDRDASRPERESYRVALRPDRTAFVKRTRDHDLIVDYDVEIAQGAAIADPIVVSVPIGSRLALRGAPGPGGLWLALGWKRGEMVEAPMRHLGIESLVTFTDVEHVPQPSRLSDPTIFNRSAAWSAFLPDGQALVLRSRVELGRAGAEEVLVLRRTGGELSSWARLPVDGGGADVVLANAAALSPPQCIAEGSLLWPGATLDAFRRNINEGALLRAVLWLEEPGWVFDVLPSGVLDSGLAVDAVDDWLVLRPYAPGGGAAEQAEVRAAFQALEPAVELLDVAVRLSSDKGRTVVARLPVRSGCSASLVFGLENLGVFDYDVEVAQNAATSDPQVEVTFDGLALWVLPRLTTDGELLLDVRGSAHLSGQHGRLESGAMLGEFDQSQWEHLSVNERVGLVASEGRWTASFGDRSLRLEVEVARVP